MESYNKTFKFIIKENKIDVNLIKSARTMKKKEKEDNLGFTCEWIRNTPTTLNIIGLEFLVRFLGIGNSGWARCLHEVFKWDLCSLLFASLPFLGWEPLFSWSIWLSTFYLSSRSRLEEVCTMCPLLLEQIFYWNISITNSMYE